MHDAFGFCSSLARRCTPSKTGSAVVSLKFTFREFEQVCHVHPRAHQNQSYPAATWCMRARSNRCTQQVANHHRAADRLDTPKDGLLNLPTSSNFIAGLLYTASAAAPVAAASVGAKPASFVQAPSSTHAHNPAAPGKAAASRQQPRYRVKAAARRGLRQGHASSAAPACRAAAGGAALPLPLA